MLRKPPCKYSSWQELVEDHAEIPYRFVLGFPIEHKVDIFPCLFEPMGEFSFSQLVPVPNTFTDWDKRYYPTDWFLENWGSLNDARDVEVESQETNDPYATISFTCNGIPVNWFKRLSKTCPKSVISMGFKKLELIDSQKSIYIFSPNTVNQHSALSYFNKRVGFTIVNGHNQNFFFSYPNPLRIFSFSRIFRQITTLIGLS